MTVPLVAFRTTGGATVGLGHVRRCVTLAQALVRRGASVSFIVDRDAATRQFLQLRGLSVLEVPQEEWEALAETRAALMQQRAEALVLDSYHLSPPALSDIELPKTVVVDAPPERPLAADVVVFAGANALNQPCPAQPATRLLLGPRHALLREEFARPLKREPATVVSRALITAGGGDATELSAVALEALRAELVHAAIDVVVGPFFLDRTLTALQRASAADSGVTLHMDPPNIWELMRSADLAVTGGGQTTYELASTGTPSVAVRVAPNQTGNLASLEAAGVLVWAADVNDANLRERLRGAVRTLAADRQARSAMSERGRAVVDGLGATRVADAVLNTVGARDGRRGPV